MSRLLPVTVLIALATGGCLNRQTAQSAKRDQDRVQMEREDLTTQRDAFKSEVVQLRTANAQMQKDLVAARQQLDQGYTNLSRANNDLAQAKAQLQQFESQRAELTNLKQQLDQMAAQLRAAAAAPAAPAEKRTLGSPATQPQNINK